MRKSIKKIGAMTLALVMATATIPAQNVKAAVEVGNYELTDASVTGNYDVTGDGVADMIAFEKLNEDVNGVFNGFKVIINNNEVLKEENVDYWDLRPELIQTKDHVYLFITTCHDNDYLTLSKIYEYADGKLEQRLDLDSVAGKIFYQYNPTIYDVKDDYIEIKFDGQSYMLARANLRFGFRAGVDGKLSVTNKTTTVSYPKKRMNMNTGKIYTSKYLVTTKKLQAYKSSSGTKKAFTIKKGTKLTISRVSVSGKKARFYCKTNAGKKGWLDSKQNVFKDLMYAG